MIGKKGLYGATGVALLCAVVLYGRTFIAQEVMVYFFSYTLSNAHISEEVVIADKTYTVVDGIIENGKDLSVSQKLQVVQTAYALALVTYSPVMNLSGTHTEELQQSLSLLEKTVQKIADIQQTPNEAKLVHNLYPIAYLSALAKLETARQTFINSGKDTDETAYFSVLDRAISTGTSDLAAFSQSFDDLLNGSGKKRFAGLGGTITTVQLRKALLDIQQGLQKTAEKARAQKLCVAGSVFSCAKLTLDVPTSMTPEGDTGNVSPQLLAQVTDTRSLLADARKNPRLETTQVIALSSSTCTALLQGPYLYVSPNLSTPNTSVSPQFMNDLFFEATKDKNGKTVGYLRDSLGISYLYLNPSTFYICPDSGKDIARTSTTEAVVTFADQHPDIAQSARAALTNSTNIVYEKDAVHYVNEALKSTPKNLRSPEYLSLLALYQRYANNSASLERVVAQINAIDAQDLTIFKNGIPFTLDAKSLFLTHSAFPSLFQLYNRSFGAAGVPIREINDADTTQTLSELVPYSALIRTIPRIKVLHDLEAFLNFER